MKGKDLKEPPFQAPVGTCVRAPSSSGRSPEQQEHQRQKQPRGFSVHGSWAFLEQTQRIPTPGPLYFPASVPKSPPLHPPPGSPRLPARLYAKETALSTQSQTAIRTPSTSYPDPARLFSFTRLIL